MAKEIRLLRKQDYDDATEQEKKKSYNEASPTLHIEEAESRNALVQSNVRR
jgi:hypothetical protein